MAETPWWVAAGAAAVLGAGTALLASAVPYKTKAVGARSYTIGGRRKTRVTARMTHGGDGYGVRFEFPYGLRSAEGHLFEVSPFLHPKDASGFGSMEDAVAHADGQMAALPWFSAGR